MQLLPTEILQIQDALLYEDQDSEDRRDLLDGPDFSVEDTLNQLLEDSVPGFEADTSYNEDARKSSNLYTRLDVTQRAVQERVQAHRRRIEELNQQIAEAQAEDTMSQAQEQIAELFTQIHHLRSGATESEIIVRDITREIKNLDIAKRNITNSITGVRRFQMLLVAYDQLQKQQSRRRRYTESASALLAVKELAAHFRTYSSIDRIAEVLTGIQTVQRSMRTDIMKDFEAVLGKSRDGTLQHNADGVTVGQLAEACQLIDAIGDESRRNLLEWYCNLQLKEYRRIFRPSEEAGQLDNLSRRYAWFRRLLKQYEEEDSRLFPAAWKVPSALCGAFSAVTKDDLKSVLVRVASGLTVSKLLEALNETTDFETEMAKKMGMPFEKIVSFSPITHGGSIVSVVSVFDPYLGIFVDAQDRTLSEMISSWRSKKSSTEIARDGDNGTQGTKSASILPSSTELFYFYRETLESCAKLSTKATFLELCNVYKKWLKVYAEEVLGSALSKSDRRSADSRLNRQEVLQACSVLNTAEYCADTTAQLEEHLKRKIHSEYVDRVSLETEKELFSTVVTAAILGMLKELELACEPAFNSMLRAPWKDSTIVSSDSQYIIDLTEAINRIAEIIKIEIEHRKYYRSFCDKAVGLILAKFTQTIVRARPINAIGAEQILLDLQRLKSCLLQLPKLAGEGAGSATTLASYNRVVSKGLGKIDIMLQVIMCPENPAEGFVDHYLVLIPCQSFTDFQKMLDLKGVRRSEQNNLLDVFLARTSLLRDLSDISVLTGVEMDGAAGGGHKPDSHSSSLPGFGSLHGIMPSSPNSALAHNLHAFMGSLPMLPGASGSGPVSRAGTPMGQSGSDQGGSVIGFSARGLAGSALAGGLPDGKGFGFKKIGRLFSKDAVKE